MTAAAALTWDAWPEADRALWRALVKKGGPLDDTGGLAHLRATTLHLLSKGYGRWLAWLRAVSPQTLDEPPERRATPQRLREWLKAMDHLAPSSQCMFLNSPIWVLSVAFPEADWREAHRLRRSVQRIAERDFGSRKNGRILSTSVLLDAGLDLAGRQADAANSEAEAALRRRDGTMVAVLALLPMRIRAFTALEIGASVLVTTSPIDIVLSADMTKNGVPWETPLPDVLEPLLRRYLDDVRPYFLSLGDARHSMLWVTRKGDPYNAAGIAKRITKTTRRLTGVCIPPHFFRDAAATSLARHSPQAAELIRPLLGHQSLGTAERHYIQACTIEAGRDYASILAHYKGDDAPSHTRRAK